MMTHATRTTACLALCALVMAVSVVAQSAAPQKFGIAVITLKNTSGITAGEAELITDRLSVELFNTGKVNVMERNQMQDILKEQGFQQSGACTDEACLVEMGQMLGVKALVTGSIGKLGSMYMINLRMIDVSTAQIAQVVSEDINGGIEEVVGKLKGIARTLVGGAVKPAPQPQVQQKPSEEPVQEPVAQPEPEPEPAAEPEEPVVETEEPASEPSIALDAKKKNRSGMRLSATFGLGHMAMSFWDGTKYDDIGDYYGDYETSYAELEDLGYTTYLSDMFLRLQLTNIIKAGRFMAVDVGAGVLLGRFKRGYENNSWDSVEVQDWELNITSPYVHVGASFVPRVFPFKFNIGFVVDVNFNIITNHQDWELTVTSPYSYDYDNWDNTDFRVNVAFGPRVGFELMAGPRVGFGFDFTYLYNRITTDLDFTSSYDQQWQFKTPGANLTGAVNFYY